MKDIELECQPSWRFCRVRTGKKAPYPNNWNNMPLPLRDIDSSNVGLILGPASGGVAALDFDGASAWTWFTQRIGCAIPDTVMWTSGKDSRCQMVFRIPEDYWPLLRTIKVTHTRDDVIAEGEGFEFRWNGVQSVMPPSQLDDGRVYTWIRSASEVPVAEMPEDILHYWVLQANPEPTTTQAVEYPPATEAEVLSLAAELKSLYPTLEYETWSVVTWAFCNTIGYTDGMALMKYHWPEQEAGEYKTLGDRPPEGRRYGIGTVKKMIKDRCGKMTPATYKLIKLEQKLKEKYNI
jgi:hypothetical protein